MENWIKQGITRMVFLVAGVAIKIPNPRYGWRNFLSGILANICEWQTWEFNSGKYINAKTTLLSPVLWCSWGGWILVMKRADVKRFEDIYMQGLDESFFGPWIEAGFGGDNKPDNYGYIGNEIVKIDYA